MDQRSAVSSRSPRERLVRQGTQETHEIRDIAADDRPDDVIVDSEVGADDAVPCRDEGAPGDIAMRFANCLRGSARARGKGARDRTVALGQRARSMMDRYLQLARPWPDDPDPDADRVFLTRQRRPFSRYTLGRVLDRLAARTGLANIYPHRFRHTFGVTYLRAGGDVLALQRILATQRW